MTTVLRWIIVAALIVASLIILAAVAAGQLRLPMARALVTLAVIVISGTLIVGDLVLPERRWQKVLGRVGLAAVTAAVVMSLLLIWSDLQTNRYLWKAWWLCTVVAIHLTHVLALLCARTTPSVLRVVRNATLGSAVLFVAMVIGLSMRRDVLALPGGVIGVCLYLLGTLQLVGSIILWIWARPERRTWRLSRRVLRVAWWITVPVLLFAGGFYLGRITVPPVSVLNSSTSLLAGLSPQDIDEQIRTDLARLRVIVEGLERLDKRVRQFYQDIMAHRVDTGSTVFTPAQDDEIRALFFTYLSYRAALFRMLAFYQGFEGVSDLKQRSRCFLTGYAAGAICYRASLSIIQSFRDDDMLRRKLNEPDVNWGIPARMFDRIEQSVALQDNIQLFEEMRAYFDSHPQRWRDCGLEQEELAFLLGVIAPAVAAIERSPVYGQNVSLRASIMARVKEDAYTPVYVVQSIVSTWIGDTRLISRPACISQTQVEQMRAMLEPGDIILERRNWFLSNAFLPGFWPHVALYVGTYDDLKEMGILDEPAVRDRMQEYRSLAHDGEARVIIESISEGVSFSSLGEATRADYVAVLRPRLLSKAQKAKAILRAFSHQGKPYDFEFDFFSTDKLVCTELIYRSFDGMLHFELQKIMGRMTLPAVAFARKYAQELGSPEQEFDLILFLDTRPGTQSAVLADEAAFCDSAERPRAFNE